MTNSKNVKVKSGEQNLANPYGLIWGPESCKSSTKTSVPTYRFLRFNDDLSVSEGVYDSRHQQYSWRRPVRKIHFDGNMNVLSIVDHGPKYDKEGVSHLSIATGQGKHIKNIYPGQVYDTHKGQVVVMPTPSEDPLVRLLHRCGMRESDIILDDLSQRRSDVASKKLAEGVYVTFPRWDAAPKLLVSEGARREFSETVITGVDRILSEFLECGDFSKPNWLLVAEMDLAEKLGPEVRKREEVMELIMSEMEVLAAKCHPLVATERHIQNVARFLCSGDLGIKRWDCLPEGFNSLPSLGDSMYIRVIGKLEVSMGTVKDDVNIGFFQAKKVSEDIYHIHTKPIERECKATRPLFSINRNDWNQMVANITEGLKKL